MTEQENRHYAAVLLNRAGLSFDAADVAKVAAVVALVEDDVAEWLHHELRFAAVSRRQLVDAIRAGRARRPSGPRKDD